MSTIAVVIATWAVLSLLSAVAGAFVAAPRNAPTCGAMAGLLLGPLGVLVAFRLDLRSRCPKCLSRHDDGATFCPKCGQLMRS
jgi:hypothetical protein